MLAFGELRTSSVFRRSLLCYGILSLAKVVLRLLTRVNSSECVRRSIFVGLPAAPVCGVIMHFGQAPSAVCRYFLRFLRGLSASRIAVRIEGTGGFGAVGLQDLGGHFRPSSCNRRLDSKPIMANLPAVVKSQIVASHEEILDAGSPRRRRREVTGCG